MTVPSAIRKEEYACNGSVVDFDFSHGFFIKADLTVSLYEIATEIVTVLDLVTDYDISTVNNDYRTGASITTVATYSSSYEIHVERILPYTQELQYPQDGTFSSQSHEDALDRLTMLTQQLKDLFIPLPFGAIEEQGQFLFNDGTDWNVLGPGIIGQVPTSLGVGADPIMATPALAGGVALGEAVLVTTNQTVAGVKAFSSFPTTPSSAPSTNYQTSNKKYVDDSIVKAWFTVPAGSYTATPASTSTITMSDTSDFFVGASVRYKDASGTFYGMCVTVTTNTSIAIVGAPLDTGDDLTVLSVGNSHIVELDVNCAPNFNSAVETDILRDIATAPKLWELEDSYLVGYRITQGGVDTTTQSKINVQISGSAVSTEDTNAGPQLSTAWAWVLNSAVAINTTNYGISYGDELEISTDQGGTGDATELVVQLIFVKEN